jgi:hypothetical protein
LTTFTLPSTFRKFGEECFMGSSRLREIRCLGPMPSFKASCLWDCPVSVFYPTTNPWPAEYVTPLYQSYQGKIQIFMGDGIEEAGVQPTEAPVVTEPTTDFNLGGLLAIIAVALILCGAAVVAAKHKEKLMPMVDKVKGAFAKKAADVIDDVKEEIEDIKEEIMEEIEEELEEDSDDEEVEVEFYEMETTEEVEKDEN